MMTSYVYDDYTMLTSAKLSGMPRHAAQHNSHSLSHCTVLVEAIGPCGQRNVATVLTHSASQLGVVDAVGALGVGILFLIAVVG